MTSVRIGTAFVPVRDPAAAAPWYGRALGLAVQSVDEWSAVLRSGDGAGGASLTLLGSASGIRAAPGLPWATCAFTVADLAAARAGLAAEGGEPGPVEGAPEVCRFFTARDPDGNTLLITDR
jgi:predicted enzyme related to lactoylglutathione lyase